MQVGIACHVCGQLNPLVAHACARCGTVLTPSPMTTAPQPVVPVAANIGLASTASPPGASPPGASTVMASSAADPMAPPAQRFDPATGRLLPGAPPTSEAAAGKTLFFGALQQQ